MEFDDTELEILDACVWCGGEDLADWGTPVRGFESVVCGSCRVIFIRNHLNAKGLKKYYRNYMSEQHQADQELNRQRDRMYLLEYEFVRRFVGAGKVLDVGCGKTVSFSTCLPLTAISTTPGPIPFSTAFRRSHGPYPVSSKSF